jgi:xanthine dehydrogenase accessory factor
MENLDVMVLRTLRDWRIAGKRALLATVVRTWGSSPRPVGSIMALCEDGAVVGSVSGGCIEDDLIYRHTAAHVAPQAASESGGAPTHNIPSGPPAFVKYGITADEAHRFGLPCGGTLELLLEFDPDASGLKQLVRELEQGRLMQRTVRLSDGAASLSEATSPTALSLTATELVNVFGPEYRMLLIGAGQLTEYLATMALFSGFSVTVCDPREEYRGAWSVPGVTLLSDMPDDVVTAFLNTAAFYVGAIGSRRNNDARRQRMIEHFGQTEASLARLRGPIGIYIGSKTPPEIAVSVMAEILAVKNGVTLPRDMDVSHAKNELAVAVNDPGDVACAVLPEAG